MREIHAQGRQSARSRLVRGRAQGLCGLASRRRAHRVAKVTDGAFRSLRVAKMSGVWASSSMMRPLVVGPLFSSATPSRARPATHENVVTHIGAADDVLDPRPAATATVRPSVRQLVKPHRLSVAAAHRRRPGTTRQQIRCTRQQMRCITTR